MFWSLPGVDKITLFAFHSPSTWGPYSVWVHSLIGPHVHREQTVWVHSLVPMYIGNKESGVHSSHRKEYIRALRVVIFTRSHSSRSIKHQIFRTSTNLKRLVRLKSTMDVQGIEEDCDQSQSSAQLCCRNCQV